jgi:hypothetical protein
MDNLALPLPPLVSTPSQLSKHDFESVGVFPAFAEKLGRNDVSGFGAARCGVSGETAETPFEELAEKLDDIMKFNGPGDDNSQTELARALQAEMDAYTSNEVHWMKYVQEWPKGGAEYTRNRVRGANGKYDLVSLDRVNQNQMADG